MFEYWDTILVGTVLGLIARLYMLRVDYRMYPGYPHGWVTHISLGIIAAGLGAVVLPALMEKDFAAVTFLALAAQQFREIRHMERETLARLEVAELVPRGLDYIEGIARTFEARNYLVMATALITSINNYYLGLPYALITGLLALVLAELLMRGEYVRDIAEVVPAKHYFNGPLLMVENVVITNVGLPENRAKLQAEGLAVLIKPKDDNARATLHNIGQRQAIIHTAAALLGTKKEIGDPDFSPFYKKDIDTGRIALFIMANEPDMECLIEAVGLVPVLESAKRKPLSTRIGRKAAD